MKKSSKLNLKTKSKPKLKFKQGKKEKETLVSNDKILECIRQAISQQLGPLIQVLRQLEGNIQLGSQEQFIETVNVSRRFEGKLEEFENKNFEQESINNLYYKIKARLTNLNGKNFIFITEKLQEFTKKRLKPVLFYSKIKNILIQISRKQLKKLNIGYKNKIITYDQLLNYSEIQKIFPYLYGNTIPLKFIMRYLKNLCDNQVNFVEMMEEQYCRNKNLMQKMKKQQKQFKNAKKKSSFRIKFISHHLQREQSANQNKCERPKAKSRFNDQNNLKIIPEKRKVFSSIQNN